jgi:L-alanine-DL-glutamate epimerase-like enolase superfamily enzyme
MSGQGPAGSRIRDVRLRVLRAKSTDGIAMAFAPLSHRSMVLVEVYTADGLVGYGESWTNYPPWAASERVATLRHGVFPLLVGKDARRITGLHRALCRQLEPIGRQWGAPGPIMQAISAVDLALWDLAGRAAGRAVCWLAGGPVRDEIPVYASSLGPREALRRSACMSNPARAARSCASNGALRSNLLTSSSAPRAETAGAPSRRAVAEITDRPGQRL